MNQQSNYNKRNRVSKTVVFLLLLGGLLLLGSCTESSVQGNLLIDLGSASSRSIMPSSVQVKLIKISGSWNDTSTIKFSPLEYMEARTTLAEPGPSGLSNTMHNTFRISMKDTESCHRYH